MYELGVLYHILHACEKFDCMPSIDPLTGASLTDANERVEASAQLTAHEGPAICEGDVRRVYPLPDAQLKAKEL